VCANDWFRSLCPSKCQTFSGVAREKVDAVFIFSNGACKYNQAKINSGEVKDQANARYELIKIPRTQEAFKQPISPILNLLSRPVRMFRFPSTDAEIEEMNSMTNQYATLLMRNMSTKAEDWSVDPEIMSFGFTPLSWQDYPGTVLVVAADGKSLSLDYVHALVDFNVTRVGRVIQRDSEIGVSPLEMIKEFGLVQLIVHVQQTEIRQVTEDGGGFNVHGWLYGYHQELQKAGKIKFVL
jgi:hypothetical protein